MEQLTFNDTLARASAWLAPPFDEETRQEVGRWIAGKTPELLEGFSQELAFGTGGMRAKMGLGSARMNLYTVGKVAAGVAQWLKEQQISLSAVIAYDSRHHSYEMALAAAQVLAKQGVRVYLLGVLRPTPVLSFAVRYLQLGCGLMITASHNPAEYNGLKVYNSKGCQLCPPEDGEVVAHVQQSGYEAVDLQRLEPLVVRLLPDATGWLDLDRAFLEAIASQQCLPSLCHQQGGKLKIIYTALHGTGAQLVPEALRRWGFSQVSCVLPQQLPDGDFTTAPFPNPEEPAALNLAREQLISEGGDLLLANDPDADRLGVVVMHAGEPHFLNGHQTALLLADHLLRHHRFEKEAEPILVKSIVTSPMLDLLAASYGVKVVQVLTGFKYIGRLMDDWRGHEQLLLGAEESHGYLVGSHARDKDGIVAACLVAEAALACRESGLTLVGRLQQLQERFGYFQECVVTLQEQDSVEGRERLKAMMDHARTSPPVQLGLWRVQHIDDLLSTDADPTLGKADLLIWTLEPYARIILRPSGTEPKLKVYLSLLSAKENGNLGLRCDQLAHIVKEWLTIASRS